jgi:hypothetical protein
MAVSLERQITELRIEIAHKKYVVRSTDWRDTARLEALEAALETLEELWQKQEQQDANLTRSQSNT